ncbi:MAG: hypothetical protein IT205_06415 [Fimbriimonadaceae bacterium]|nr:hypothetical protein [Fimbriimonadaceae bacterium]
MPESSLYALYRLFIVDLALLDMRKRAAALDGGKALAAEVIELKAANKDVIDRPDSIQAEIKDLENKNIIHREKVKNLEKQLYGGSVVNAKEAAGYEQEIAGLKGIVDANELRVLELIDELPSAQAEAKPFQDEIATLVKQYTVKKKSDQEEAVELQARFKSKSAERPPLANEVEKPLLAQYEAIRQKYGGIGMGVVEQSSCGACGTLLPTKVVESLDSDRIVTCESCHRLLIKLVPGS